VTVGLLVLDCFIGESLSLKDKRRILTSVTERARRSFNVALCEVEFQDQWQRARIAAVMVNTDGRMLESSMSKLVEFVDRDRRLEILSTETRRLV